MSADKWEALQKEFSRKLYRKKPGKGDLTYVPQAYYLERLNEIFGPDGWTFEILETWFPTENEVVTHCRLTIGSTFKDSYGGDKIKGGQEIADVLKSAQSDAMKKCCSLFGLGLHLYIEGDQAKNGGGGSNSQMKSAGSGRLSTKQMNLIRKLANDAGWDKTKLDDSIHKRFNKKLEMLSADEASSVIDGLQTKGAA